MNPTELLEQVRSRARKWLGGAVDEETRRLVQNMLNGDESELIECFYRDLEFGTGGLRGIMGVGTNRMNIYIVAMATQGLSNYLKKEFRDLPEIAVAVAHDSRINSRLFAETTARIFSANGFRVYLFGDLRPTPQLSFAVRHFKCQSGVVITASHNPKEYNGYKAYWNDGGQIIAPHDKRIIEEVRAIQSIDHVNFNANEHLIIQVDEDFDEIYLRQITALSLSPEAIQRQHDMKIVYTPLHGAGVKLVPQVLSMLGFTHVSLVPEQAIPDGNFPTVHSPNPEESTALSMAVEMAKETSADLVMATDPDADRVGIVVRDKAGEYVLLNGNQAASILIHYLLERWHSLNKLTGSEYIVKTIVTTELLAEMAARYGVTCYNVLTGFKFIADVIRTFEGKQKFIGGGEESYGYLAGDFVRDKDAVMSCALFAEAAAFAKNEGKTLIDKLMDIYTAYGLYKEKLISVEKKGKSGQEEIQQMMKAYRSSPPAAINGSPLVKVMDYLNPDCLAEANLSNNGIDFPKSDVLQFFLQDGTKISVRPSGTEPKIKFYFGVREILPSIDSYSIVNKSLDDRITHIIHDLKLD